MPNRPSKNYLRCQRGVKNRLKMLMYRLYTPLSRLFLPCAGCLANVFQRPVKPRILRWHGFSRRIEVTGALRLLLAVSFSLVVLILGLCLGKVMLSPQRVAAVLMGEGGAGLSFIVEQLRLPRLLLGALIGAALAVSGLILQAMVRNPLASPDLLGLSSGASAAAVLYLSLIHI